MRIFNFQFSIFKTIKHAGLARLRLAKQNVGGFTILELLIVIAIMTMLSSLAFIQFQTARARGRDSQREKEVKTLQDALALYATSVNTYPVYSGAITGIDAASLELIAKDAITKIPIDPTNVGNYKYIYDAPNGTTYTITYYLETASILGKQPGAHTASP